MRRPSSRALRAALLESVALGAALLALLVLTARPVLAQTEPPSAREVERAAAAVYPALVNISAVSRHFAEGREMRFPSAGSGVVVTSQGHVLTNFHVAGDTARIRCTLTNGDVYEADVVAHDPLTDLSVLELRLPAGGPRHPLAPARLAVEGELQVGDPVLALGNPFALSSSVTLGIVSNPKRVFTDFSGTELSEMELEDGQATGWFTQWIQHDALILPGNSGGPLVDLDGAVVGINELGGGGMGFAIPARVAAQVLARALAEGSVRRSFLGFFALPVSKLGRTEGALVSAVLPDSPAAAAGLEPGDLLLALGGEPVAVRFFEQVPELYQRIAELPVGTAVELEIERRGERRRLAAKTVEMERLRGPEAEFRTLGLSAEQLTASGALARNLRVRAGLLVTGIRPGQAAATAKPQVQAGDVLVGVGEHAVSTLDALASALEATTGRDLLLRLRRGDEELFALAHLPERPARRWGGELPKAWLGVQTQVLTPELAEALGVSGRRGFRVTEIYPWTEAERAGLAVGDLVLGLAGEPFDAYRAQDAEDLRRAVEDHAIGEAIALAVLRAGREIQVPVRLEERPAAGAETPKARQEEFEFSVRDVTFLDRIERHWQREQQGVLVTEVTSGGWANMAGLKVEDLVVSIGGVEIADASAFEREMQRVVRARPAVVEVFVRRGARTHFVFIEPAWNETGEENGS